MPKSADPSVAVGKGVDQLKLIVKHAALDQHGRGAVLGPIQELTDKAGHILRKRPKVQNAALRVHDAHISAAKLPRLPCQTAYHDTVCLEQVLHIEGGQFIQPLIDLEGVLDLCNVLRRGNDPLAVEHGGHLVQRQRVLLNGQRGINGAYAIRPPQHRAGGKPCGAADSADQLPNFHRQRKDLRRNRKQRLIAFHSIISCHSCYHHTIT